MRTSRFIATLARGTELTDELAEAIYGSGCDDGSLFCSCGVVQIGFDREAESLEDAIRSAIADVQKAGCTVAEVTLEGDVLAALPERT
ncbi:MAG: hypothetical protein GXY83_34715 [Rhodopirellula sp.]|nr:hypothetical protein [Rhodopirellula sp.]